MVSMTRAAQRQAETQVMTQSADNLPSLGFPSFLCPGSGSYTSCLPGTKRGPMAASWANVWQRKGVHCTHSPISSCDIQGRDRAALLRLLTLVLLLAVVSGASRAWSLSRDVLSKSRPGQVWALGASFFVSLSIHRPRMPVASSCEKQGQGIQRLQTVLAVLCPKSQGCCDGPPEIGGLISTPTLKPELCFPADALQSSLDSGHQGT